jgi:hypothetical protein
MVRLSAALSLHTYLQIVVLSLGQRCGFGENSLLWQ